MRSQLRLRVLLPLAVLALAGLGVGAFAYGGKPSGSPVLASADSLRQHRKDLLHQGKKHAKKHKAAATHKASTKHKAKTQPEKTKAKPKGGNPLSEALADHPVVVVFLYTPGSVLDQLASAEARAGAQAAGAGYLSVDVRDESAVSALAIDFDVRDAPGVLVFTRGPHVATEIDGYADRSTVAQAAENATA